MWASVFKRGVLAVLVSLVCLAAPMADARDQVLTPAQMRSAALQQIAGGRPDIAMILTDALLARNPDDVEAMLIRSRAARDLKRYDEATTMAKRAWRRAEGKQAKHASALLTAQALSSEGRRTAAQLWLRRAIQFAPDQRSKNAAIRDFRYVRNKNPWSTSLRFNIAPNSNINNGSSSATSKLFDLPFDFVLNGAARALSGLEIAGGVSTRYRLSESVRHATDVALSFDHRTFVLSKDAKAQLAAAAVPGDPIPTGADFATTSLSLGLLHRWTPGQGRTEYLVGASAGKTWFGGDPYGEFLRLNTGANIVLTKRAKLHFSLSGDRNTGPKAPHANILRVSAGYSTTTQNGSYLKFSATLTDSRSAQDIADYRDLTLSATYAPRQKIFGAQPAFDLDLRTRDYPVSRYAAGGRLDREIGLGMRLIFTQVDYYGFNPTLTISARHTKSDIDLFDADQYGIQFGIQSAF